MTSPFTRRSSVDFSDIKATVSPFAVRPGEKIECVLKERKYGYIDKYTITENEKLVLRCVNFLSLATSKQVFSLLSNYPITHDEIHKILTKFYNGGYLRKLEFVSDLGKSSYKVYTLCGGRGSILYQSVFEQRPSKTTLIEMLTDVADFKRILACNQFMCQIEGLKKTQIPSHFQVFTLKRFLQKPLLLRTGGYIETNTGCVFIEGVRREDNYVEKFKERLSRYERIILNYKKLDSIFDSYVPSMPSLLIIAEDKAQQDEIMQLCKKSKLAHNTLFTHDMALVGPLETAFKTL